MISVDYIKFASRKNGNRQKPQKIKMENIRKLRKNSGFFLFRMFFLEIYFPMFKLAFDKIQCQENNNFLI